MFGYRLVRDEEYAAIKQTIKDRIRPVDPEIKKMADIADGATFEFFNQLHPELREEFLYILRRTK